MEELEEQVRQLRQEINEKNAQLHLAGEMGNKLLETVNEKDQQMEELAADFTLKIEAIEQEKYGLQLRLDQRQRMESNFTDEIENLKTSMQRQKDQHELFVHTEHTQQCNALKKQIAKLQSEAERQQLLNKQKEEKMAELESNLAEVHEQLDQKVNEMNETSSDEIAQLFGEVNTLQSEKMLLESQLADIKRTSQQMALQIETLQANLSRRDEEIEEVQCQATSYFNALERSREENQELHVELDLIKMETQDQKTKGNSLFSEVEDRRIKAEKELITVKVKYDTLYKQHGASKNHLHKLKMQMASLLHMSSGRADEEYVESLRSQLNQALSDVSILESQLHKKEKEKNQAVSMSEQQMSFSNQGDDNFTDYVKALLERKEKQLLEVQEELQMKRLMLLAESDRVRQSDRKVYSLERSVEQTRGQNMKLKLLIEELQLKYEPDKCKQKKGMRKTIVEKIPLTPKVTEENKENDKESETLQNIMRSEGVNNKPEPTVTAIKETGDKQCVMNREVTEESLSEARQQPSQDMKSKPYMKYTKSAKQVSISSNVEIIEDERDCVAQDAGLGDGTGARDMEGSKRVPGRPRGKQRHHKVIKAKDSENNECKTQ